MKSAILSMLTLFIVVAVALVTNDAMLQRKVASQETRLIDARMCIMLHNYELDTLCKNNKLIREQIADLQNPPPKVPDSLTLKLPVQQ